MTFFGPFLLVLAILGMELSRDRGPILWLGSPRFEEAQYPALVSERGPRGTSPREAGTPGRPSTSAHRGTHCFPESATSHAHAASAFLESAPLSLPHRPPPAATLFSQTRCSPQLIQRVRAGGLPLCAPLLLPHRACFRQVESLDASQDGALGSPASAVGGRSSGSLYLGRQVGQPESPGKVAMAESRRCTRCGSVGTTRLGQQSPRSLPEPRGELVFFRGDSC